MQADPAEAQARAASEAHQRPDWGEKSQEVGLAASPELGGT